MQNLATEPVTVRFGFPVEATALGDDEEMGFEDPGFHGGSTASGSHTILPGGKLDDVMKACDTFGNAAKEKALEVILTK